MPSTQLRQSVLTAARNIVVKLGTQLLTGKDGMLDRAYLGEIARQVATLRERGYHVTVVSSGAIGAGCRILGLPKRPKDVAELQAVAAVGQRSLMNQMHDAFAPYKIEVAQLLLTRQDFDDRIRYLNIRNCIAHLQRMNCIPIINENDTVAVDELRFGDNDMLAALMCNAIKGDALVLLTVVDGLLDRDNQRIDLVEDLTLANSVARNQKSALGTGGITSKIESARLVTEAGEVAIIANGREQDVLLRLFAGEKVGTVFVPSSRKLASRARWIGLTKRPAGTLVIDDGAAGALRRGKSLLATGITETTGRYSRGELLLLQDTAGNEIARGLSNYSADEVQLIKGHKTNQFEKILGRAAFAEVVHRDNLVLTQIIEKSGNQAPTSQVD